MDELSKKLLTRTLSMQCSPLGTKLVPVKKNEEKKSNGIDCKKCVHFFVTWEKACPYGCKAYGFKSFQMPSITVKTSSGENCNFFKQRS